MTQTLKDKISESENKHFQAGWQAGIDFMKNREEKINNSVSGKEDVKLPEVGKRYRANFDNMLEAEIEYISKNKEVVMSKLVNVGTKITVDENKIHSMDKFIKYFVELPEDNIEIKPEWTKPLIVAVDEGKEGGDKTIYTVYCGEENPFPEENPKSIWKNLADYINNTEERLKKLEGK